MDLADHLAGGGASTPQQNGQLAFQGKELLVHTTPRGAGFRPVPLAVSALVHVSTHDPVSRS
ncbi:hypothetical protein GCM10010306_012020 [Streptomyces umbrinus]|nr:hypothetical protein GCM10010306_012020 [Streptomyces umbrinus]